jgi:hypothetical protein
MMEAPPIRIPATNRKKGRFHIPLSSLGQSEAGGVGVGDLSIERLFFRQIGQS